MKKIIWEYTERDLREWKDREDIEKAQKITPFLKYVHSEFINKNWKVTSKLCEVAKLRVYISDVC